MPYKFTNSLKITNNVDEFKITSFTADIVQQEIHVEYESLTAAGVAVGGSEILSLQQPDFSNVIAAATVDMTNKLYAALQAAGISDPTTLGLIAGELAKQNIYDNLKAALYEQLITKVATPKGINGTVT